MQRWRQCRIWVHLQSNGVYRVVVNGSNWGLFAADYDWREALRMGWEMLLTQDGDPFAKENEVA